MELYKVTRSVTLLQTHEENIMPYTVKNDSARAVTTFSRNFRFFHITEMSEDARVKI